MKTRVLVLGCNGMLGHMVSLYLKERGYDVTGFARKPSKIVKTLTGDATNLKDIRILTTRNFDYIINCIGVLNDACDKDPCNAILINSYLPHYLAEITKDMNTKVIHISTDCVFSGNKGNYTVHDLKDANSIYGMSKSLGEINDSKNITIRTSIVGPDLNKNGIGLFNWFMHQKEATGYTNVFWTGLTTLELAKVIEYVINVDLTGLYNIVPNRKISKYELLCLFAKYFNQIEVTSSDTPVNDKSLVSNFVYNIIDYEDMIKELREWIDSHGGIYE